MSLLLGPEPFQKFGVGGGWWWWVGGGGQKAFKSSALVQTLDLDLKLGPSWTIAATFYTFISSTYMRRPRSVEATDTNISNLFIFI